MPWLKPSVVLAPIRSTDAETGPRLPTLLLAIGAGRVRELLAVGGE